MQSYSALEQRGPGLWIRDGEWYGTTFRRRMTVMALAGGDLVVHNAFELKDADLAHLRTLGNVAAIVMPNAFHGTEVPWMAEHLPEAKVFVPEGVRAKVSKVHRVDGTLEKDWPEAWNQSVVCLPVGGLRLLHESVFFHPASRTLVLTDLAFHLLPEDFKSSLEKRLMSLNRTGNGFGPSWLCDTLFTKDHLARKRSIEQMLQWDFDRVVINHGHVIETGGRAKMREAFSLSFTLT